MDRLVAQFIFITVTGTSLVFGTLDCDTSCLLSNQFDLEIKMEDSDIDLSWTFNQSKAIYGFQMIIYNNDEDITYESPILHSSERSMSLEHELEGENNICLVVFENSTTILDKKCDKFETKDLKIIIGILAGTIFLVPCIAGLIYIIYKDNRVKFVDQYKKIDPDLEKGRNNIEVVVHAEKEKNTEKTDNKKSASSDNAAENKAFVNDEDVKQPANADQPVSEASVESFNISSSEESVVESEETEISEESNAGDDVTESSNKNSDKVETNDNLEDGRQVTDNLEDSNNVVDKLKSETDCVTDEDVSGTFL